jgi:hypothetical protein
MQPHRTTTSRYAHQQLVRDTAQHAVAVHASGQQAVSFVNEDDAGLLRACLLKQCAHVLLGLPDEHGHQLGACVDVHVKV